MGTEPSTVYKMVEDGEESDRVTMIAPFCAALVDIIGGGMGAAVPDAPVDAVALPHPQASMTPNRAPSCFRAPHTAVGFVLMIPPLGRANHLSSLLAGASIGQLQTAADDVKFIIGCPREVQMENGSARARHA